MERASLSAVLSGSPGGAAVKDAPASSGDAGDLGLIPESGRSSGVGSGNPLQYSRLGNPVDKFLAGYSPRGHKELDTTEQLITHAEVERRRRGGGPKPLAFFRVSDPQGGTCTEMEPPRRDCLSPGVVPSSLTMTPSHETHKQP